MDTLGHGVEISPTGRLLGSSVEREWRGIFADLRSHPAGEVPTFTSSCTEVAMLIRGQCTVIRRADRIYQQRAASRGTIWLCPAGLRDNFTIMFHDISEVLHLYLPANPFSVLETDGNFPGASSAQLHYHAGVHDLLIERIADCVLTEMRQETSAGSILIESLASSLAARLLQCYSSVSIKHPGVHATHNRLADRRLQQVLNFIEAHIEDNITVEQLASLACLSQFHFAREFKAATGKSPYQHVTERRLVRAKALLAETDRSLAEIAYACGFSSPGNFWRAFRRSTGATPGCYRAQLMRGPGQPSSDTQLVRPKLSMRRNRCE
jgi:AraC family transcriptional regulator